MARFTTKLLLPFLSCVCSSDYKSKGGFKHDDLCRRREEQVEIRRQKREENISKRRYLLPASGGDSDEESGAGTWDAPVSILATIGQHHTSN